ncbi:SAM-dependent methyltransferase [Pararcticibacter amylolyticus]|uniref:SAM-dependent methyltransferase n=2 Tax=Pararcticibacter amylolyticus TaxID=2173175 RepID=A0A2U2PKD4_9SPHI|nr:SAM-dependent methyltransferase [Pararcticibacter amylolyticus]
MPVDVFFRTEEEMPELELLALDYCKGKILDIGAGAGSHALLLQERNARVTALELSPGACDVMKERGVRNILQKDIFDFREGSFDTLLMLMNGIGLSGTSAGLRHFLKHIKKLLAPGGRLLCDSSDISYLYEDSPMPEDKYFGEVQYQYEFKNIKGPVFKWLYVDWRTFAEIAEEEGYFFRLLHEDGQDQYLAMLELK